MAEKSDQDGLEQAKRIMERLVNTPPTQHKDIKPDEPTTGKPRRGRPRKPSGLRAK